MTETQQFALLAGVGGLVVVYLVTRAAPEAAKAAGKAAGDVVQGEVGDPSSPYYGKGIPGTLGTVANEASGGSLEAAGRSFGNWLFGVLNPEDAAAIEEARQ